MRPIPSALAAHLAEAATTLCRCWRLVRTDGLALGFTDHDRDLRWGPPDFPVLPFAAGTGWEAAETVATLGFAVGGGDVSGALSADAITEADIAAGRFDGARVEVWTVNWAAPAERMLLGAATIGEIRRADGAFVAELRDPFARFDEPRGLTYRRTCSADLGDARCGVDLGRPGLSAAGVVLASDDAAFFAAGGLEGFAPGFFDGGQLRWSTGGNAGLTAATRACRPAPGGGSALLALWNAMPSPIAAGDAFTVSAGCDKTFATCGAVFANRLNFRGFPHMPGNDFVLSAAGGAGRFDGGSLFR